MAIFQYADNARSTLGAALSVGGTTITLASGGGALFPLPGPGQQFALTLNDLATQALFEIVYCTARAGDVLTVIRAQEGTAALAWGIGDYCWNGPTAGQMNNLVQLPHMTDASIAPVFGNTQVQGTLGVTGPATFSSTGSFSGGVSASGAIVSNAAGANLVLQGSGGTSGTPNKTIRSVNGILDILNSANSAEIFTLSDLGDIGAIRNLTAAGTGTFAGPLTSGSVGTFYDPTGTGGVIINALGSGSATLRLNGTGAVTPVKYVRATGGQFQVVNNAFSQVIFAVDDAGNITCTGNGQIPGTLTVGTVAATDVHGATVEALNGNVTANNGRLRATLGAYGSGDPNAGVLLADFQINTNANGVWWLTPDGFIVQMGNGITSANPMVVFLPTTFPSAFLSVVACEGAVLGWGQSGFQTATVFGTQIVPNNAFQVMSARIFPPADNANIVQWQTGIAFNWIAVGY